MLKSQSEFNRRVTKLQDSIEKLNKTQEQKTAAEYFYTQAQEKKVWEEVREQIVKSDAAEETKDIGNGMGAMLQAQLLEAQKDNIEADTEQKKVNTAKTAGVDTELTKTQTNSLAQGIENQKAQKALTEVETNIAKIEAFNEKEMSEDKINGVMRQTELLEAQAAKAMVEAKIDQETINQKIGLIKAETIGKVLENQLTTQQITQVKQAVKNSIAEIHLKAGQLDVEVYKAKLTKALGEAGLNLAQQKIVLDAIGTVIPK